MGTISISGVHKQTLQVDAPNTTVNVSKNAEIYSTTYGIYLTPTAVDSVVNIDGYVTAAGVAVYVATTGAKIHVGKTAEINSANGIYLIGADSSATNDGTISAIGGIGMVDVSNAGNLLRNNGSVTAVTGMYGTGDGGRIVNGAGGDIVGLGTGVQASAGVGEEYTIVNHGRIVASTVGSAIMCSTEDDKVTNDGKVVGGITLGGGDDTFDNRGGSYSSTLAGGTGDDVLIVDNSKYKLTENSGEGTDTVKSTVSYTLSANVEKLVLLGSGNSSGTGNADGNTLQGNSADNLLKGLAGLDHLYGRKGDDRLMGGADGDYFHFAKGDGNDTILDLVKAADHVDISAWNGIDNLNELKSHASNQGGDVIIEFGGDSLLIKDHQRSDLATIDFIY